MAYPHEDISTLDQASARRATLIRWAGFVGVGLILYAGLFIWAETLARRHADSNRFHRIATAPLSEYDHVILGASHAMPFDFDDMNRTLEDASATSILNLSIEGGGVLPAQVLLDYFLEQHSAQTVIFFLDSFAFYSPEWNEERLQDISLFRRAPVDPALARVLWRHDWARKVLPAWLSGFGKINDPDRMAPDRPAAEPKFDRVYRPVPQIDRQRVAYLYPSGADPDMLERYLGEFATLIATAREAGAEFVVVKPPVPDRYRDQLPDEAAFDAAVGGLLDQLDVPLHDFSRTITDPDNYYDTDHLNRDGVSLFAEQNFISVLEDPSGSAQ